MILACEICGDTLGYFRGVAERFICEPCLEKALMGIPEEPGPVVAISTYKALARRATEIANESAPSPSATGAPPLAATAPVFFRCPSCNRSREWFLAKPPWQGAVCRDCYAEELMRRDEARKARGGQDAS